MPNYYIKPVAWNTNNYTKPSGVRFRSGFPAENGFGYEEWNGNSLLEYIDDNNKSWRAFHTQSLGLQPVDELAGNIFIFMIASTGGTQQLVGIAGMATSLRGDENQSEKRLIRRRIGINSRERRQNAWDIQNTKDAFNNNRDEFNTRWAIENRYFPTWKCPSEYYVLLESPIQLDPVQISGNKNLIMMFGSYQSINKNKALYILNLAQANTNRESIDFNIIGNLIEACQNDELDIETDINEVNNRPDNETSQTEKQALIQARKGQGKFRQDLISRWHGCAVNGSTTNAALRASHIKPWRDSTDRQRLDVENGILLSATLDALFDSGLITFDNTGQLIISSLMDTEECRKLGIVPNTSLMETPTIKMQNYLQFHREMVFKI